MATIPLIQRPQVQNVQVAGVRQDGNSPVGAALGSLGQAMQQTGEILGRVALQRQDHVNRGILANEENVRMSTAAQIQTFMDSNQDKPETWGKYAADSWKAYDSGVMKRQQAERWAPDVVAANKMQAESYRTEAGIHFATAENKAMIRQANARLEANADIKLDSGDVEGAKAAVAQMNLFPDQKQAKLEQVEEKGISYIANQRAVLDPFSTLAELKAQRADGEFANFKGINAATRVSLIFRAEKLANETRSKTRSDIAQQVADAMEGAGPMPDKEKTLALAARQGISPKWVERAFKPPGVFDAHEFAQARNEIAKLDLVNDPDSAHMARAIELVTQFKGPAMEQLGKLVKDRSDPAHPINANPIFKEADQINGTNFRLGLYGKFENHVRNEHTGEVKTVVNAAALRQAEETQARVRDALMKYVSEHPKATHEEVTRFMNGTYRAQVTKTGAAMFQFNK